MYSCQLLCVCAGAQREMSLSSIQRHIFLNAVSRTAPHSAKNNVLSAPILFFCCCCARCTTLVLIKQKCRRKKNDRMFSVTAARRRVELLNTCFYLMEKKKMSRAVHRKSALYNNGADNLFFFSLEYLKIVFFVSPSTTMSY